MNTRRKENPPHVWLIKSSRLINFPKIGVGEFRLFTAAEVQGRGGNDEVTAEGRPDMAVGGDC